LYYRTSRDTQYSIARR